MVSYFYKKKKPEKPVHDPSTPYPELGEEFDKDRCFQQLMDHYHARDTNNWRVQVDRQNFKQHCCFVDDNPMIVMKAKTTLNAPVSDLVECQMNTDI